MRSTPIVLAALAASWIAYPGPGLSAESAATEAPDNVKGFEVEVRKIEGKVRRRMTGSSWRPGCPVDREDLRHPRHPLGLGRPRGRRLDRRSRGRGGRDRARL